MAEKVYVDAIGVEILVDCKRDLTGGLNAKLLIKKPNGSEVEWLGASVYQSEYIRYETVAGDLNVSGGYEGQPYIELGVFAGRGKTFHFHVHAKFE
jgi:hypothetical protein